MKLRDYQLEALESVISSYEHGINNQLVVLPTGSGKTVVMASILKHFGKKSLVIAHRKEIITQNKNTIEKFCKTKTGTYASGLIDLNKKITIGSIQSCYTEKSINLLKKENFEILIIDEAHHSSAKTYMKLISELGFSVSKKLLIGFTATPDLSNGNTLGDIYGKIVYSKQISELIKKKYLSDVTGRKIKTGIDINNVKIKGGDYYLSDLSKRIDAISRNKLIVRKYKIHTNNINRKAIAFCVSISHAKSLSEEFNKCGIKSEVIYGTMPKAARKSVLSNIKRGKIEVLTSVVILIEGFDMPEVNTIIMARPTKSKSLYIQMVGRGLRIAKNKDRCLVLDFIDKSHNLKQDITLDLAIPFTKTEIDIENGDICKLPEKYVTYDLSHILKELEDSEFNIVGRDLSNKIETTYTYKEKSIEKKLREQKTNSAKKGLEKKLKLGEWSAKAPFGYINVCNQDGHKNIIINEEESKMVLYVYNMYSSGKYSLKELVIKINADFNISIYKSKLHSILKNPFYHGIMISNGKAFQHKYETIISKTLFDCVNNKKTKSQKETVSAYKRLMTCEHCNCMITSEKHKGIVYYHCTQSNGKHGAKWLTEEKVTDYFVDVLRKVKKNEDLINIVIKSLISKNKLFAKVQDKELTLYAHSLINNLPMLFKKKSLNEKREFIDKAFENIQIKDDKVIMDLKTPLELVFTNQQNLL